MSVSPASPRPNGRAPSGPRALPLIGTLPWMLRDPLTFLRRAAAEHGDVVDLGPLGRRRSYLVAHPDGVEHVLSENSRNYVKGATFEAMKLIIGEGLAAREGEGWLKQRRLVQPAFHRQKILAITQVMVDVALATVARWDERPRDEPLDLTDEMMRTAQAVLLRAVLGVDRTERADELSLAWNTAFDVLTSRLLMPLQPPVSFPTPANLRFKRAMAVLDEAAYGVLRARRASGDDPHDLLSLLLAAKDEATGAPMTDRELRDEIMTFFAAGFETPAVVLAWAFHLLGQHPEIERNVCAELDAVLAGRAPTADDIGRLSYTKRVLEETLRLYPGAWILVRSNVAEDEVCGFSLPPGSIVFVSPYVTQRLPELWENPDAFDPDRFLPSNARGRPRFAYFPFGGGPRQCVGDVFVTVEMQILLAVVLQRYRLIPVPGETVVPRAMATLRPRSGPRMFLKRRAPACAVEATGRAGP